ncbi:MAG TPA: dioxygenase [Candidatus Limnocylindria bacterium]|jgi:protocatechuate 3,4-dioxygenase beta subunit|nr:dioxygenase [Candidatus Limnocylindria bacterium]
MSVVRVALAGLSLLLAAACSGGATLTTPSSTPTATAAATASSAPAATAGTQAALACTSPATPLVNLTEGPYYKAGAPQRSSLMTAGVAGTPLVLTGYVVSRSCQSIANAKLDFWQADGNGNYDNSGYTLRGWLLTDARGAYRLETVIPGLYPGRTEHIHFKVTVSGQTWTSQLFFPGISQNESDSIYSAQMLIKLDKTTNPTSGTFTFVVNIP